MALTQFKECALVGTDGNFVKFSPITEGVDGASRTILVTEVNEPILIEDDQTVFTSVKNTITIVATLADADAIKLNDWVTNDIYVGFAGYTIDGLAYSPTLDDARNFRLQLEACSGGGLLAHRGDSFQIAQFMRVSEIKQTYKIVLTQTCLQGKASNGIRSGLFLSQNLTEGRTVTKSISAAASSGQVAPLNLISNSADVSFTATGSGFNAVSTGTAAATIEAWAFFPFNVPLRLSATGNTSATAAYSGDTRLYVNTSGGTELASGGFILGTAAGSTGSVSLGTPTGAPFAYRFVFYKSSGIFGGINFTDINIAVV